MMHIDRCICHDRTFKEIKKAADQSGLTSSADLKEIVDFGSDCGLCGPYIDEMLTTGKTVFTELIVPPGE